MRTLLFMLACATPACSFDDHRHGERCERNAHCPGTVCRDGLCTTEALDAQVPLALDAQVPLDAAPALDMAPVALDQAVVDAEIDQAVVDAEVEPDMPPHHADPPPPFELPASDPGVAQCDGGAFRSRCWLPSDDAHVDQDDEEASFGFETELEVRWQNRELMWAFLRFDLGVFSGRRWPDQCEVVLTRTGAPDPRGDRWLLLHRASPAWFEGDLTWLRRPGDQGAETRRALLAPRETQQRFAVGPWVLAALAEGANAVALRLEPERASNGRDWASAFHSKESDEASARPILVCRYDAP